MSTQSWQIPCPRCGWANSGALTRCAKCGQPLGARPGMLVAGQSLSARAERPASTKVAKPGGFLPRLIALIIDLMILGVILLPINALWAAQLAPLEIKPDTNLALETLQRRGSLYLALVVLQLFYFAGSWTMLGATPGQLLMSLRVTDSKAGGVGFFRATMRWFWFTLFGVFSVLTMLGKNKRALHDLLAGTYVIQVVDATEATGDPGLPPALGGEGAAATAAPAPAPIPPAPAPAPVSIPVAAPVPAPVEAPVSTAPATGADFGSTRPAQPPSAIDYLPPPSTTDFPVAPMSAPAPLYVPEPLPGPPPANTDASPAGDEGLYAPPPMIDRTTGSDDFAAPASPPAERQVYTPQPGQLSERALKSAQLYSAPPEFAAPAAPEPAAPEPAAPGPAPAETPPATEPHEVAEEQAEVPAHGREMPLFDFPPMAPPPPEEHP